MAAEFSPSAEPILFFKGHLICPFLAVKKKFFKTLTRPLLFLPKNRPKIARLTDFNIIAKGIYIHTRKTRLKSKIFGPGKKENPGFPGVLFLVLICALCSAFFSISFSFLPKYIPINLSLLSDMPKEHSIHRLPCIRSFQNRFPV